ncbi:MAG: hypothetical protein HYU64_03685 [Armatimonadetes bacterium]|nr:hypothetical protein [Armatimonadota bacterium]
MNGIASLKMTGFSTIPCSSKVSSPEKRPTADETPASADSRSPAIPSRLLRSLKALGKEVLEHPVEYVALGGYIAGQVSVANMAAMGALFVVMHGLSHYLTGKLIYEAAGLADPSLRDKFRSSATAALAPDLDVKFGLAHRSFEGHVVLPAGLMAAANIADIRKDGQPPLGYRVGLPDPKDYGISMLASGLGILGHNLDDAVEGAYHPLLNLEKVIGDPIERLTGIDPTQDVPLQTRTYILAAKNVLKLAALGVIYCKRKARPSLEGEVNNKKGG